MSDEKCASAFTSPLRPGGSSRRSHRLLKRAGDGHSGTGEKGGCVQRSRPTMRAGTGRNSIKPGVCEHRHDNPLHRGVLMSKAITTPEPVTEQTLPHAGLPAPTYISGRSAGSASTHDRAPVPVNTRRYARFMLVISGPRMEQTFTLGNGSSVPGLVKFKRRDLGGMGSLCGSLTTRSLDRS